MIFLLILSEGEIVVPADVVNYWGVKLFEDLRAQAKLGYNQMAEDGRIGGEPMDMVDSEPMPNVPFDINDLEVVDGPEEAFFGGLFGGSDTRKSTPKRDRSMSAVLSRAQANKNKPKNRAEAIKNFFDNLFSDDDDKPSKPVTTKKDDNKSTIDFGFKGILWNVHHVSMDHLHQKQRTNHLEKVLLNLQPLKGQEK